MDRPLKDGQLALDDGQPIQLTGGDGNHYRGTVHMEKDGAYHVAAIDEGQPVRLSEDYFIATDKAQPPEISLDRPRGDYRASPIEEVTLGVKAADQFGLNDVHLHYSVNGGPERSVSLLDKPGAKSADGSHTLALEDFKLAPGDVVSVYASARDGHAEAHTDISFIQVDPFEREFSQSQQSGGGGGGGGGGANNQTEISKREKELIAATWKQQNDKTATAKDAGGCRKVSLRRAAETSRPGDGVVGAHQEPRSLRGHRRVFRFRQRYAGGRRSHGAFGGQTESHAVEGCASAGAESAAGAAARGSDLPQDPGSLRPERWRRWQAAATQAATWPASSISNWTRRRTSMKLRRTFLPRSSAPRT